MLRSMGNNWTRVCTWSPALTDQLSGEMCLATLRRALSSEYLTCALLGSLGALAFATALAVRCKRLETFLRMLSAVMIPVGD